MLARRRREKIFEFYLHQMSPPCFVRDQPLLKFSPTEASPQTLTPPLGLRPKALPSSGASPEGLTPLRGFAPEGLTPTQGLTPQGLTPPRFPQKALL